MRNFKIILILFFSISLNVFAQKNDRFDPTKNKNILDLVSGKYKEKLVSALEDAGANYKELCQAISEVEEGKRDDLVWLVLNMPHLDRLTITCKILIEHLEYSYLVKDKFLYEVPEDLFKEFILVYRIGSEPVEGYRKVLFEKFYPLVKDEKTSSGAAKIINEWIFENISLRNQEFFGQVLSPLLTLKGKKGTEEEIAILTTAILKSIGIPSRRARARYFGEKKGGSSWVEIYDLGKWVPLYPLVPKSFGDYQEYEREKRFNITAVYTTSAFQKSLVTENYTQTGKLILVLSSGSKPAVGFKHFSISVFNDGSLCPLDELGFLCKDEELVTDSTGCFEAVLGDGTYYIETGVRDSLGNVFVRIQKIEIKAQKTEKVQIDVSFED